MKLYKSLEEIPAYIYIDDSEPMPENSIDVTDDIQSWHDVGEDETNRDYLYRVDQIKRIVESIGSGSIEDGFNLITTPEKIICCEHKIGTQNQRIATVGENNAILFGIQFSNNGNKCRSLRVAMAFSIIEVELSNEDQDILRASGIKHQLYDGYVIYGVYGTNRETIDGLYDWMYGLGKFEGIGVKDMSITPKNMTLIELIDKTSSIFFEGDYDVPY